MTQLHVDVFRDGEDRGYLGDDQRWWFNPAFPHAFSIFDLDGFYSDPYFERDHVGGAVVEAYTGAVLDWGARALGRPVRSIAEFGSAGGWFTKAFIDRGIDVTGVEGTHAGLRRCLARGVPASAMHRLDLRRRIDLGRRFDIALCTEVAEHIEPPFSSQLVENLVRHAPLVWFSFEEPGTNAAHYHHCNEQPTQFWRNLFEFFGYGFVALPAALSASLEGRGRFLAFDRSDPAVASLRELDSASAGAAPSLGVAMAVEPAPQVSPLVRVMRELLPPLVVRGLRRLRRRGVPR